MSEANAFWSIYVKVKISSFHIISINQSTNQSINQSKFIPLQEPYSEALPTQAKRKRTVLRRWWKWEQAHLGGALDLLEVHSTLLDQPQKKNGSALQQSRQLGSQNYHGPQCTTACAIRDISSKSGWKTPLHDNCIHRPAKSSSSGGWVVKHCTVVSRPTSKAYRRVKIHLNGVLDQMRATPERYGILFSFVHHFIRLSVHPFIPTPTLTVKLLPRNNFSSFCKLLNTFLFGRSWTESASEQVSWRGAI